jgi:hypothetical protein
LDRGFQHAKLFKRGSVFGMMNHIRASPFAATIATLADARYVESSWSGALPQSARMLDP